MTEDRLTKTISDIAYILDCLILLRQIQNTGDCNVCKNKGNGCPVEPKAGQMVRYNCPFYKAESEIHCSCTDDEISKSFIEDVSKGFEEFTKMMFKQGNNKAKSEGEEE